MLRYNEFINLKNKPVVYVKVNFNYIKIDGI